ncbi:hypothetical protein FDECE_8427 [Fusarium decemcellulare]|nr:hypothetical protein FDECE_8427 [Fusarium decemcellulare]
MIPILGSPDIRAGTDFVEPTHGALMSSDPSTTATHPSAQPPSPSNSQNPAVAVSHGNRGLPPKIGARFTIQTVKTLRDWLNSNSEVPYPSDEDKIMLQKRTGLNQTQISNWLANARRRNKIRTAKSARPQSDGSPALPIDIPRPSTPYVLGGRTSHSNPLQRWVDSPPEDEAASITAIARALSLPTSPVQHSHLSSDQTPGQSSVSSAGVSSNDSSALASSQISRSTDSSLLVTSKDHLVQHLRLVHDAEYLDWTMSRWKSECNSVVSRCGFCGIAMDSWHARQDHLAEHFRMGDTMTDWKGDWGFEDVLLELVQNSMPPYLISEERNSPFPFSATVPPVESPSNAYELIKLEASYFIISHQEKVGCRPTDTQLQLEACRVIFASEALSKKVGALPSSWLRDLIMGSKAIAQQARYGPLRSPAESRLATLKVNRQDHLFQHCPMEQLLQGYVRAASSDVSDEDPQSQACGIILDAEKDPATPCDIFVDWLLRHARSSPAWLFSFRRRTFGLDNMDTTSTAVEEPCSDAVESPTHVDTADDDFITAGVDLDATDIQGMDDSYLFQLARVYDDPIEHTQASLSQSPSSLQCHIFSPKPWLSLASGDSSVNKNSTNQPTVPRNQSLDYSSTAATTTMQVGRSKHTALYFSNDTNSYHRLAQDLTRFVRSTTSPNNPIQHVPTDEELQHHARCILYNDDGPWNQTAADNPEWLLRFKVDALVKFLRISYKEDSRPGSLFLSSLLPKQRPQPHQTKILSLSPFIIVIITSVDKRKMDSFSNLPSLVLTNIIIHIESEKDILQLIQASPVVLAQYVRYRRTIMRHRLNNILAIDSDGTVLQDAQAIIHFPPVNESASMPRSSVRAMFQTLNLWSDKAFANPLTQSDHGDVTKLYRFFCRLIKFIEDYLAKALDSFPSRAYLALPDLTSVVPTMHFKGRAVDVKPVPFGTMKGPEKCRLLRAFVRYELLCKVYHPRVWNQIEGSAYAEIVKRSHEKLTLKDYEALCCVHEYLKGLYGALFAHCGGSWFPDRPTRSQLNTTTVNQPVGAKHQDPLSSKDYGLLYPDSVYFSAQEYSAGVVREWPIVMLPCLGLDLLSSIVIFFIGKFGWTYNRSPTEVEVVAFARGEVQKLISSSEYGNSTFTIYNSGYFVNELGSFLMVQGYAPTLAPIFQRGANLRRRIKPLASCWV